jgi:hypothetical protein
MWCFSLYFQAFGLPKCSTRIPPTTSHGQMPSELEEVELKNPAHVPEFEHKVRQSATSDCLQAEGVEADQQSSSRAVDLGVGKKLRVFAGVVKAKAYCLEREILTGMIQQ